MNTARAGDLPCEAPPVTAETAPFWAGCAAGELRLPRCSRCDTLVWYPRAHCPACGGTGLVWETLAGTGTIYSFTRIARGTGGWSATRNYIVAVIELAEGPRILSNIDTVKTATDIPVLSVGSAVIAYFDPVPDSELALLRFRLPET